MGASVVPGFPAFTSSEAGNGSAIPVTAAAGTVTVTGAPEAGDVVHATILLDGSAAAGTDVVSITVGATPTDTSVATALEAAIAADAEWTAIFGMSHSGANITFTLVSGQRPNWGRYTVKFVVVPEVGSTLGFSPNPLGMVPTGGSGVVSVVPLTTFPYSANGQQMTFYKGQVTDMPISLARELYAAKLVL